jgi:phosphoglycerate dehydrogenase-like enzyme
MPKTILVLNHQSTLCPLLPDKLPGWKILAGEDAPHHLHEAEILYGWDHRIDTAALADASALRWIQATSAGVDYMPMEALRAADIWLTTASGVHANSISESILAMMLSFVRQLYILQKRQLRHEWNREIPPQTEIHGKTIGILGVGAIGGELARLCKAFGMRVLGFRRSGKPAPFVDHMTGLDGLAALLAECDFVVNILPLTPDTEGLVGTAAFAAMKPTALYFTAGRGRTTDTAALLAALQTGQIAGAGLDVVDPEPLPPTSPLWDMENVFIGGHHAGMTDHYAARSAEIFLANLEDYLAGKAPGRGLVDYGRGY